jgi:hypothetical protein
MNLTEDNVFRVVSDLFKTVDLKPKSKTVGFAEKKKTLFPSRNGGASSYHVTNHDLNVAKLQTHRCYRVLTYKENSRGQKQFIDIMTGAKYSLHITHNACVFETKKGAKGERFPPNQYGHSKSGCGVAPRVLVAFECWGHCHRRIGGGISSQYEFAKCAGIVECLDPIYPHSKKQSVAPVPPHFFPKRDLTAPPRKMNRRDVRVERAL